MKTPKTRKADAVAVASAPRAAAARKAAPKPAAKPVSPPAKQTTSRAGPAASVAKSVAKPEVIGKPGHKKEKLVRDSFTMPRVDFALIGQLKERGMGFKREIRKSELLRAGLQALAAMSDADLRALLDKLPKVKTGRPHKGS
jgi:hypothetical protein